jgi:predicted RNA binding protein YcfA (HicA-like mRNA interferase family)
MKIPRNLSGSDLAKALGVLGYVVSRQHGSHLRITTEQHGQHHEVVPNHRPVKLGTLQSILRNVARHHGITVQELMEMLNL